MPIARCSQDEHGTDAAQPNESWPDHESNRSRKVIEATDGTFKDAGKVGVWTKADSVTLFDDFTCGNK